MAAFVIAAYMKGVPMLYNGQEVGTPYRLTFPFTSTEIDWSINPEVTAEYKKIIALRNRSAAIRRAEPISFTNDDVCAFTKNEGQDHLLVIVNVRNRLVSYPLPSIVNKCKDAFTGKKIKAGKTIELEPYQYRVFQLGDSSPK
jgi:glycosidase